jgi:hypothetical protein
MTTLKKTSRRRTVEAKVDIQKLQILCDRINQTADALNQVRMTVSGLSHSSQLPNYGFATQPLYGYAAPMQGLQPMVYPWQAQQLTPPVTNLGLQHAVDPRVASIYGTYGSGMTAGYGTPFGISHSSAPEIERRLLEAQARDPYRLGQTFPFAFYGRPVSF